MAVTTLPLILMRPNGRYNSPLILRRPKAVSKDGMVHTAARKQALSRPNDSKLVEQENHRTHRSSPSDLIRGSTRRLEYGYSGQTRV